MHCVLCAAVCRNKYACILFIEKRCGWAHSDVHLEVCVCVWVHAYVEDLSEVISPALKDEVYRPHLLQQLSLHVRIVFDVSRA